MSVGINLASFPPMKFLLLLCLTLWGNISLADDMTAQLRLMEPNHPSFPDAIVALQTKMLKEKKWENVLGIAKIYRTHFPQQRKSFRVEPFLMEAYSLIQFCRFQDARSVLELGEFYAKTYGEEKSLKKIQKAQELEKLSQLYKNLTPPKAIANDFGENQLEWEINPGSKNLFEVLDRILIKTRSLCQS